MASVPTHRIRSLLRTARDATAEVGAYVAGRHRPRPQPARRKGVGDFVTEVDIRAEKQLARMLLGAWPDHGFLGEETEARRTDAPFVWVVDPIDGTSNFARGLPMFAVSVACLHEGQPVAAAVHCEPEGVVYSAALGLGAHRGRRRLVLADEAVDDAAVVGVQWHRGKRADLDFVRRVVDTGARVRVFGSTVTELCDVAAGRLTANVQEQGKLWDFAAAALIVTEAGGRFTDWRGKDIFPVSTFDREAHLPSLAAGPRAHRALLRSIRID